MMDAANRYFILAALADDFDLAVGALPAALLAALALPRPPAPAPQIPPAFHGAASSSRAKYRMAMGADRKFAEKPAPEDEEEDEQEWTEVASRKYKMPRGVSPDPDPVVPTEDEYEQDDHGVGSWRRLGVRMRDLKKWIRISESVMAGLSDRIYGHVF